MVFASLREFTGYARGIGTVSTRTDRSNPSILGASVHAIEETAMSAWSLEEYADVLLDFRKLEWFGSCVGGEMEPIRDPRHARWMRRHTQRHRFRELLIGLSGTTLYGFKGNVYRISPGTVMLLDSDEEHDDQYPSFDPSCRHIWLHEPSKRGPYTVIWHCYEVRSQRVRKASPPRRAVLPSATVFWESWDLLRAQPGDPLLRGRFFAAFVAMILDVYEYSTRRPPSTDAGEQDRRAMVAEIAAIIEQNLDGDLSLDHLARLAGYSKFHFLRLFQQYQGCSLKDYICQVKLGRAKELLRQGLKTVAISEQIGFANPSAFYRFFRQQTGERPSAYSSRVAP